MGPLCCKKRVQDTFHLQTPSLPNANLSSADRKSVIGRRGQQTPTQRGSGEDRAGRSRLLFSYFPCSQEKRKITTHNRSVQTEHLSGNSVIQNGNSQQSQTGDPTQRLGDLPGPDRCVLACSHSQTVPEVPPILSQGSDVSVQGSPVRPCNKSLCLYPRDGCHSNLSTEEGDCTVSVPGRLVGQKSDSSGNSERSTVYTQVDYVPGTDNQRREVGLGSISELCVYRNGISYTKEYSSSAVRQNTRHSGTITMVRNSRASLSKSLPVSSGKAQCSIRVCRTGQIALTSASDGIVCSVEAPCTPIGAPHSYQCSDQAAIRMVEQQGTFHLGCNIETVSSNSHSVHGCESLRMGSPSRTRRTSVSWSLDSRPISSSYQYSRDESNIAGSETMSSVCRQFDSTDCHRQLFSSLLPEETRGHPFSVSVHGGVGHASLVQSGGHRSSGQTSTRKVEHIGRQVEPSFQANCDRMDLGSDDLQFNSVDDRFSERRPVCNSSQQETASLCIAHSRRECTGDRRNVNELGPNACICFSSICTDPGDNQQDSSTSLQNSTGSSSLGRNVLVSRHTSVTCSTSNSDPLGAESSYTGGSKTGASKSRKSKTSRLEFIRRSITDRKFSANVARHASQARRSSTRRVYDAKWKVFSDWCCQRETHPFNASPMVVADFLLHLFTEKKCQVSTIKGYRSTISNTLKFKSDVNIGSDPIISELIRSFELQRPVQRSLAPKWDLSYVLSSLCSEPYEPLHKASGFHLTLKTVFLLAMATARRVSEIHAFSMDSGHLRFNQSEGSVSLRTQPGFLAKNQLPSVCPDDILVPNLAKTVKFNDFNRLLCPVRALKRYLKVTEPIRKNRKRLFLPLKGNHDITKGSISRWISYTIRLAYKKLSKSKLALLKIQAHELRALSASWSYLNKIPVEDVIKAAVWSSRSTFAKFYLRDMNTQGENLRLMGPVVSAQKTVGGQSGLPNPGC